MATAKTSLNRFDWKAIFRSNDMIMALGVILLICMMIVPIPAVLVDVLVIVNLAMSLGVMLLSLYISRPMDFSIFPSLLLVITLFRLGLNISISRLILIDGNAGEVVKVFGNLVIGGNYVVGVVIFLMLMIIQFAVITNGAGRVAEVAARFTLDAMPGKQMSIDADLNAGLIDEDKARFRRKEIQTEADFYGSMDGASKFVRGDAIAASDRYYCQYYGRFRHWNVPTEPGHNGSPANLHPVDRRVGVGRAGSFSVGFNSRRFDHHPQCQRRQSGCFANQTAIQLQRPAGFEHRHWLNDVYSGCSQISLYHGVSSILAAALIMCASRK